MDTMYCVEPGRRIVRFLMVAFACIVSIGCSDTKKDFLKTYPVQGKATYQGKPMSHALVTLYAVDGEAKARYAMPHGTAGEDGVFRLGTYRVGDGAPPGRYTVTLAWPNGPESRMGMPGYVADQLQGRYADAKTSTIQATIVENDNPPITINLP